VYTLGTSALKWILSQTTDPDVITALTEVPRIVAFVGTPADRTGDASQPATMISPYSLFFEAAATSGNTHEIQVPFTTVTLYKPVAGDAPYAWVTVAQLGANFVTPVLLPASGISNAQYAIMRGNKADLPLAYKVDGLGYWAKDTDSLYYYDESEHDWILIAARDKMPIGFMRDWPAIMGAPPAHYLWCDGSDISTVLYPQLFAIIGHRFEATLSPAPAGFFRLPHQDNSVIRFIEA
jgi:hypothetical protein